MKQEITIRLAQQSDHDAIWEIFHECVASGDTYEYAPDTPKEQALELWLNPNQHTFVTEYKGKIVGTYILKANRLSLGAHVANAGYMVAKNRRGLGVGRLMADHSFAQAKEMGFKAMQYNFVVSTNHIAIKLWQKLGFEIIGTIPEGFHHQEKGYVDAHIMWRKL